MKPEELHLKELERDHMPAQVATEMLTDPRVRRTNQMRKSYREARQKVFVSTREPESMGLKIAARLKTRPLASLVKWLTRSNKRRMAGQRAYLRAHDDQKLPEKVREALMALLEVRVAEIDLLIEGLETEIRSRAVVCKNVKAVRTGHGNAVKFQKV